MMLLLLLWLWRWWWWCSGMVVQGAIASLIGLRFVAWLTRRLDIVVGDMTTFGVMRGSFFVGGIGCSNDDVPSV